jgi:hypothetical protein
VLSDRATLGGSLSLHALRTPSVVGPMCAALTWSWHGATLASPLALYAPLSPARLSALDFHPRPGARPPLAFFSRRCVARTPPCRASPIPSFLLFPTQARMGSAPWRCCSPPRVPLVIPPSALPSFPVRCATTSVHRAINATLLASPPSHLQI